MALTEKIMTGSAQNSPTTVAHSKAKVEEDSGVTVVRIESESIRLFLEREAETKQQERQKQGYRCVLEWFMIILLVAFFTLWQYNSGAHL